jgi:hypothetical protein
MMISGIIPVDSILRYHKFIDMVRFDFRSKQILIKFIY